MTETLENAGEDRPLRVALVSTEAGWYGGERQGLLLATILRERGHSCAAFVRKDGELRKRLESAGVPTVFFRGRGRDPLSLLAIRRGLKEFGPDVIHLNDGQAMNSGLVASWGIPALRVASRRAEFPIRSASRYKRGVDLVLCVSEAVRAICRSSGIPDPMLRVVPDGVDPLRMQGGDRGSGRASLSIADSVPMILTVARISPLKGHEFLIRAMKDVVAHHPDALLALAGEGELTEDLKRRLSELGLAENVRFLGFRNDVPDLMKAADLFVLPSVKEGLGTSVIDAMFAGCPIVTTEAGGIPELVRQRSADDRPCAWLVPHSDPEALSDAILEAMSDTEECRKRSALAMERAFNEFTAEAMAERTLSAYRDGLKTRSAS